jgi:tRNA(Ile)-lysidine synthase
MDTPSSVSEQHISSDMFSAYMESCAPFEARPTLAIALSGGIDSMALLLLAGQWVAARGGKLIALTVDHGLRPESFDEALAVQTICQDMSVEHHLLRWRPPAKKSALQQQARDARYELLTKWCIDHDVLHLLTAHHRDDQVETLFFRLARGSDLRGLACMPAVTHFKQLRLLRPLLEISKQQLVASLNHKKQQWLEDKSNHSPAYTRNRIRHTLRQVKLINLYERTYHCASHFGITRKFIEINMSSFSTQCVSLLPGGYAYLHSDHWLRVPEEYRYLIFSNLLHSLSGSAELLRESQLRRLYESLQNPAPFKRMTGFGLQYMPFGADIAICREAKKVEGEHSLKPYISALWDNRFTCIHSYSQPLTLKALSIDGVRELRRQRRMPKTAMPVEALRMLPSFWDLETLVSVPHIHYHHPNYGKASCRALFTPAKPLAGTAFSAMNKRVDCVA